ncbi:hypothetical protein ABIB26_004113 [Arthrobacter sp. UYEF20]
MSIADVERIDDQGMAARAHLDAANLSGQLGLRPGP